MQQKCKFGKTKLLTIFPYSQCCAGHIASLQIAMMLLNQIQAHLPAHKKANLLTPSVQSRKVQSLLQAPGKENRQFKLKRPKPPDGFLGRGFKGSVSQETAGCMISSCTILRSVGIKVKFQASSTFWFQVQGLYSCDQHFSSGVGGLLPIKATQECSLYLSGNCKFTESALWQTDSPNFRQFPSPTAMLCFYVFTFPCH